jgi:hypothetical protein
VKVDVKVARPCQHRQDQRRLRVRARAASNDAGEISSAELEMKEKALVYNIKM